MFTIPGQAASRAAEPFTDRTARREAQPGTTHRREDTGRAASAQGWYGGRTVASTYNPWTGGYGAMSQGHNAYGQWGHSVAARGDQWVQTGHVSTARGTAFGYRGS